MKSCKNSKKIGTPKSSTSTNDVLGSSGANWHITDIVLKLKQFNKAVLLPKDVDGMANSVDPNQTAPEGAV